MPRRISLTQYLVEQQRDRGQIPPPLRLLCRAWCMALCLTRWTACCPTATRCALR